MARVANQATQKELCMKTVIICQKNAIKQKAINEANAIREKEEKERQKEISKAEEYVFKCERKRIERAKRKEKIKYRIAILSLIVSMALIYILEVKDIPSRNSNEEPHYESYEKYETTSEPSHIVPTKRVCKVIEVKEVVEVNNDSVKTKNIVTVDYNGNNYSFEGDGYFVGETIRCSFTDNMEIVDAEH